MKENKIISIASVIICVISLLIVILTYKFLPKEEEKTLICDLSIGTFTGAIISASTALATYFSLKKKEKNRIIDRINKILNKYKETLASIEYTYDARKLKAELEEKEIYEEYSDNYNYFIRDNYERINKNVNTIITMKKINYVELKKLLKELTILDKKAKNITDKINETIMEINKIIDLSKMYKSLMRNDNIFYFSIQNMIYQDKEAKYIEKKEVEIKLEEFNNKLEKEIEEEIAEIIELQNKGLIK